MTPKEEKQLKEKYFLASSKRTGIPLQFYTLTAEMIEAYESEKRRQEEEKQQQKEEKKRREKEKREGMKKLNPTRGDADLSRKVRRSVGDFSIIEPP